MYLTKANDLQNVVLLCDYSASNSPLLKFWTKFSRSFIAVSWRAFQSFKQSTPVIWLSLIQSMIPSCWLNSEPSCWTALTFVLDVWIKRLTWRQDQEYSVSRIGYVKSAFLHIIRIQKRALFLLSWIGSQTRPDVSSWCDECDREKVR